MKAIIVKSETDSRKWNAEIYKDDGFLVHVIVPKGRNTSKQANEAAALWIAEREAEDKKEAKKEKKNYRPSRVILPRIAEDGSVRCTCCNEYFPASEFSKDSTNKHGFQNQTRAHIKASREAKKAAAAIK